MKYIGKSVLVIGTLFKTQVLKPNILKEVGEENEFTAEKKDVQLATDFIDETDELVLEDELQRARLDFGDKFKVDEFVTGIVCAVLGCMIEGKGHDQLTTFG